jgi:hypothetical protein
MRLRREIVVDWARAVGDRVPIVSTPRGGFQFNEPALAVGRDPPVRGIIGWDPSLGWVLVLEPSAHAPRDEGTTAPAAADATTGAERLDRPDDA